MVAAHRGVNGGNIPCNSLEAYEIAIRQGADIIELDVSVSKDGELFLFHPGMEKRFLGQNVHIPELTASEIEQLRLVNGDGCETQYSVPRFDSALEQLKNKCLINIDKFWSAPELILRAVKRHGMEEQCIVKSVPEEGTITVMKNVGIRLPYVAMLRSKEQLPEGLDGVNWYGCELLFANDGDALIAPEFIRFLHTAGKAVWLNSICYDFRDVISADHTDDRALLGKEDEVWGWLCRRGADIIQTDWTLACKQYLEKEGYR